MVRNRLPKRGSGASLWWRPRRRGRSWFWLRRYRFTQWVRPRRRQVPWGISSRLYLRRTTASGWWRRRRIASLGRWRRLYRPRIRPGWPRRGRPRRPRPRRWPRRLRRWGNHRRGWWWRVSPAGYIPRRPTASVGAQVILYRGHNNFWGITKVAGVVTEWTAGRFQSGSKRGRHHAAVEVARAVGASLVEVNRVVFQLRGLTHPRRREELVREVARAAGWTSGVGVTLLVRVDRPHNGLRLRKARRK